MFESVSLAFVLALAALSACASSEAAPEPRAPAATPAPASASSGDSACVEVMSRNRTCTDDYIPALVDARARHDQPPGIAEAVKSDRDGVIAKAKEEWKQDSTDEAIAAMCGRMAGTVSPAEVDAARTCLAKPDCATYTTCIMPSFEQRLGK